MEILILLLMVYAGCGLIMSLGVHVCALFGIQPAGNTLFFALHIGIFPLWIPVALIASKMTNGMRAGHNWGRRMGHWNALLAGAPAWMRVMTNGFLIYALVNFAIFFMATRQHRPAGAAPPSDVWRGFSGHWMVFYSAGLTILTVAYRKGWTNLERRCPNGHRIGHADSFCPTCGVRVPVPSART
jgi:hypothetical protein